VAAIARSFRDAEQAGALLVLDEADAIALPRADSAAHHPGYKHATEALLLALEQRTCVTVLTTNFATEKGLDAALESRLLTRIHFPAPELAQRKVIWDALLPPAVPRGDDVDLDAAAAGDLTGRDIKQAVIVAVSEAGRRTSRPESRPRRPAAGRVPSRRNWRSRWASRRPDAAHRGHTSP